MPRSRSMALLSITRSATCWFSRKTPPCLSISLTSVVLPWSTWAMMAMLRMSSLTMFTDKAPLSHKVVGGHAVGGLRELRGPRCSRRPDGWTTRFQTAVTSRPRAVLMARRRGGGGQPQIRPAAFGVLSDPAHEAVGAGCWRRYVRRRTRVFRRCSSTSICKHADHAGDDLLAADAGALEGLDGALLAESWETPFDELLALHRVCRCCSRGQKNSGANRRNALDSARFAPVQSVSPRREDAGVEQADDVARIGVLNGLALVRHELLRLLELNHLARAAVPDGHALGRTRPSRCA